MGLFDRDKPFPVEEKEIPPAKGLRLFFRIFFREFSVLIKVNLLFFLFCIPIVTIPAAFCAMTRISLNMVREKNYYLWEDFWKTFRAEFMKATLVGIICGVWVVALAVATWFYGNYSLSNSLYLVPTAITAFGAVMIVFVGFSLFPMLSLVDLPLKALVKNAILLVFLSIFRYVLVLLIFLALLFLALMFFPLSLILVVFLYPSLLNYISVYNAYAGIKKHVLKENDGAEDAISSNGKKT